MPEKRTAICRCCELPYYALVGGDTFAMSSGDPSLPPRQAVQRLCGGCRLHQGDGMEQRLKRFEEDEPKLRKALAAARKYAKDAEVEVKESRGKIKSALRSRDDIASRLKRVQEIHTMRGDGSCTCGARKNCKTAEFLFGDSWLQRMLSRSAFDADEDLLIARPARQGYPPARGSA